MFSLAFAMLSIIYAGLTLPLVVLAGHPLWEIKRNVSVSLLEERWFTIGFQGGNGPKPWPDATIRYCFESDATRSTLKNYIVQAMKVWYDAGLNEAFFKMKEVSSSTCQSDRANVLLVKYNDQGILASSPGKISASPQHNIDGPQTMLSLKEDVGMLDAVANIAHELGHAWGLAHEHQRPELWGENYFNMIGTQMFVFNCQNLKDYATMQAKLNAADLQRACTEYGFAVDNKFSAAEFLPIFNFGSSPGTKNPSATDDDVDWDSLMLYASGCGGVGTANSPTDDQRAPIILKASDNSRIPVRKTPSALDIAALSALYIANGRDAPPNLLNQPSNPSFGKFRDFLQKIRPGHCL